MTDFIVGLAVAILVISLGALILASAFWIVSVALMELSDWMNKK